MTAEDIDLDAIEAEDAVSRGEDQLCGSNNIPKLVAEVRRLRYIVNKRRTDTARLDWLERNSYAFVHCVDTGKGFIRLSRDNDGAPYGLRRGIDNARATIGEEK